MLGNQLPKVEQMFRNAQRRELLTHGSSQPPHEVEKARIQRQCSSDESPDRPRARHGRPGQNEPPSKASPRHPQRARGEPRLPGRRGRRPVAVAATCTIDRASCPCSSPWCTVKTSTVSGANGTAASSARPTKPSPVALPRVWRLRSRHPLPEEHEGHVRARLRHRPQ